MDTAEMNLNDSIYSTNTRLHLLSSPCPSGPSTKRLRSCLSPPRRSLTPDQPDLITIPSLDFSSRSTSFSSDNSFSGVDIWRRTKSVRWEGEALGCAVTNYHETYSATEYDRSPLEPPSEAERNCVLPERGSRCLRTKFDCFATVLDDAEILDSPVEDTFSVSPQRLIRSLPRDSFTRGRRPLYREEESEEEDDGSMDEVGYSRAYNDEEEDNGEDATSHQDGDDDDTPADAEWEECMARRRMMFSMLCRSTDQDRQPEFEGYRSISSTLAELLRSVGCDGEDRGGGSTPVDAEDIVHPTAPSKVDAPSLSRLSAFEPMLNTPSLSSADSSVTGYELPDFDVITAG